MLAENRAHPRSRGENPTSCLPCWRRTGLIPAHAGKTQETANMLASSWAHPRSRGENIEHGTRVNPADGSSPLTRGKLPLQAVMSREGGLIPAHAGKTTMARLCSLSAGAHPRSRGENIWTLIGSRGAPGSSPLTRGKPCCGEAAQSAGGLIPAHAGKTFDWP